VDHINRDKTDNRIENLRWATRIEQNENRCIFKNNISGHKFISYNKIQNKWVFQKHQGKYKIQKYFKTKTEALCYKFIHILKK